MYEEPEDAGRRSSLICRLIDSFKRDPNAHVSKEVGADETTYDLEGAAAATAASPLHRRLKGRHLQMIAIGGSIGETSQHHGLGILKRGVADRKV